MAYAYPIPDTPYWYAGSNLIVQTKPKQLSVSDKYARWKKNFLELSNGAVQVTEEEEFLTGWRPASAKEDPELVRRSTDGRLLVRPHWHNGVRNSPAIVAAVMKELR